MAGYTKLFSEIITSTIWQKDSKTRIVWITMLALANRRGKVAASVPGLARLANVKLPECEKSLKILKAPDPHNEPTDYEGRYIKETEGGFQMLNFAFWREKIKAEERRSYLAGKQAEHRAKLKKQGGRAHGKD